MRPSAKQRAEGNRGLAKLCGYVFVAVLKWDKCKGFYILERKTKRIRLKIWKRVKKKSMNLSWFIAH